MAAVAAGTAELRATRREEWRRAWRRFRASTLSLVGLAIIVAMAGAAVLAPVVAPHPEHAGAFVDFGRTFRPPSRAYPFGTDDVGRDVLSRVIYGARISLSIGVVVLAIALAIGVTLGLIAGYWTGWWSSLIMRVTDVFLAIPSIVLALAVTAVLKPSLTNAMIAIAFTWWPWYTRLVYGEVLSAKQEAYVEASRSVGASPWRVAFREILPNVWSPVIVKLTLDMGFVILVETGLSFLGLGAQPPTPAWGTMIAEGRIYMPGNWWLATFPGLAIFLTVLGFNLLGDGLRDVFDVQIEQWRGGA
ncbi:MAG: ABC transporter permease [Armatimonadota bacterium]|nr:ABC transporter permease [Armatimonadota bacterium]MDR7452457.1 ABC transporter permease [Armatimonadota bacterium]MDR7466195.1 ABC transporter permease [Armatimonadota bacterium]MDR7495122.1 ABC transporter permease [Armatimonadota bacterium]MDR7500541.1 ABC transporter permease [Armatimonadota bacterium]